MSDDNQELNIEEQNLGTQEEPIVPREEQNLEEQKAKQYGHLSKEQYIEKYGSEEGYKSPEEFNKYGKAYDELKPIIQGLHKKLDEREKEIKAILDYNERLSREKNQQNKLEIDARLSQAKEYGNTEDVEKLVLAKAQIEQEEQIAAQKRDQEEQQRAISEFSERNRHWLSDPLLNSEVARIDAELGAERVRYGRKISYSQMAMELEQEMARRYPDKVIKPQPKPIPVIQQSTQTDKPVGNSIDKIFNSLDQDQVRCFNALNRHNKSYWTKERYINKLKADGEI